MIVTKDSEAFSHSCMQIPRLIQLRIRINILQNELLFKNKKEKGANKSLKISQQWACRDCHIDRTRGNVVQKCATHSMTDARRNIQVSNCSTWVCSTDFFTIVFRQPIYPGRRGDHDKPEHQLFRLITESRVCGGLEKHHLALLFPSGKIVLNIQDYRFHHDQFSIVRSISRHSLKHYLNKDTKGMLT